MHMYIVQIFPWVQQTVQLHPWYWNTLFSQFHLFWGEFSTFSEACHYGSAFFIPPCIVLITAGWTEAAWNETLARHFHPWPAAGTEPQTFWSWVQYSIHVATVMLPMCIPVSEMESYGHIQSRGSLTSLMVCVCVWCVCGGGGGGWGVRGAYVSWASVWTHSEFSSSTRSPSFHEHYGFSQNTETSHMGLII